VYSCGKLKQDRECDYVRSEKKDRNYDLIYRPVKALI